MLRPAVAHSCADIDIGPCTTVYALIGCWLCRQSSAEASQDAGPRFLSDATASDSPRGQPQQEATTAAPASRHTSHPQHDRRDVSWDVQLSLVTHACGGGRAPPAVSLSLWDECTADASGESKSTHGISLEVQGMTATLVSAPQKPLRIEAAVPGVTMAIVLLFPTDIRQSGLCC